MRKLRSVCLEPTTIGGDYGLQARHSKAKKLLPIKHVWGKLCSVFPWESFGG